MGDFYLDADGKWVYDEKAPSPGQDPALTRILNAVTPKPRYRYSDPVADPDWPRVTEPAEDDIPDAFPGNWAGAPTPRDQAAIDAGNA